MKNRLLRSQLGISFIEVLVGAALSGAVVYGGYAVLTATNAGRQSTDGQAMVDRELAAGTLLANNAAALKPFVGAEALGDCLVKERSGKCAGFAGDRFLPLPANTKAPAPVFQTMLTSNGSCEEPDNRNLCLVKRTMEFRWLCSNASCTGLETRVTVTPLNALAGKIKPRTVSIKLDRRQFLSRDQLAFYCDAAGESMTGVDYDNLRDICVARPPVRCRLPSQAYLMAGANDCREELSVSCGQGFSEAGLNEEARGCASAGGGRTVAGGSHATSTETNTITVSDTRTSTSTQTIGDSGADSTVTATSTSTTTVTDGVQRYYWRKAPAGTPTQGRCPDPAYIVLIMPEPLGPCTTPDATCDFTGDRGRANYTQIYRCEK